MKQKLVIVRSTEATSKKIKVGATPEIHKKLLLEFITASAKKAAGAPNIAELSDAVVDLQEASYELMRLYGLSVGEMNWRRGDKRHKKGSFEDGYAVEVECNCKYDKPAVVAEQKCSVNGCDKPAVDQKPSEQPSCCKKHDPGR